MDTEIALSSLSDCLPEELHRCFVRAFGDYAVPMDLPLEQFGTMLVRNGFDADLSVGAFHDGQLVGFVFNGVRDNISGKLAYDSGTAVLPRFRGRGIATRLVRYSMDRLAQAGVYGYVLECIASNETALELYRKSGFRQTRHLDCWQAETETLLSHRIDVRSQYQF
ncbi:MAG: GNAT family N-acetyltransferase, partial [Sphaerochaetaceae bacterium]